MSEELKQELQDIKKLTLLSAKTALTMEDASLMTGLAKNYLYKLVSGRKIPYYKSKGGKLTYFNKDELTQWLLNHRVSTEDEIEQKAISHCNLSINQINK